MKVRQVFVVFGRNLERVDVFCRGAAGDCVPGNLGSVLKVGVLVTGGQKAGGAKVRDILCVGRPLVILGVLLSILGFDWINTANTDTINKTK